MAGSWLPALPALPGSRFGARSLDLVRQKQAPLAEQQECVHFAPFLSQANGKNTEPKRRAVNLTSDRDIHRSLPAGSARQPGPAPGQGQR